MFRRFGRSGVWEFEHIRRCSAQISSDISETHMANPLLEGLRYQLPIEGLAAARVPSLREARPTRAASIARIVDFATCSMEMFGRLR
jgi:hypothetical protein